MTRNLFFACVLFAGAAVATGWALAPGCTGSFCLGKSWKTDADRDRAGASEVPGAGRELLGGNARESAPAAAPEARLPAEGSQASWSEPAPLKETEQENPDDVAFAPEPEVVIEDWQDRPAAPVRRSARTTASFDEFDDDEEPELSHEERKARAAAAAKAAKEWESLAEAALKEPDDELRGQAINSVGLRRSVESVAVLNEVAVLDPSPDNRLQAIQQLWYSAADGLDSDRMIRSTLQTALDDPDEAIAEMAEKALADLEALEQAREYN